MLYQEFLSSIYQLHLLRFGANSFSKKGVNILIPRPHPWQVGTSDTAWKMILQHLHVNKFEASGKCPKMILSSVQKVEEPELVSRQTLIECNGKNLLFDWLSYHIEPWYVE